MTDDSTMNPGPWPDRAQDLADECDRDDVAARLGQPTELISMPIGTLEELTDELRRQCEENRRLRAALALRPCVSQATGVLMFRYGLDQERALDLMARWSDQLDVGLRDFAATVLQIAAHDPESLEANLFGASPVAPLREGLDRTTTWGDS